MMSRGDVISLLHCGLISFGLISLQTLLLQTNTAVPVLAKSRFNLKKFYNIGHRHLDKDNCKMDFDQLEAELVK
jgi:hypothetical protein